MHRNYLAQAYFQVMAVHNQHVTTDVLCNSMIMLFNQWHTSGVANGNSGGLGGFVTAKLVKQYLKEKGSQVVGQQLQCRLQQPRPPAPVIYYPPAGCTGLEPLTVRDLAAMTHPELRDTCKMLGVSQTGNSPAMTHRIKQKYGMPMP